MLILNEIYSYWMLLTFEISQVLSPFWVKTVYMVSNMQFGPKTGLALMKYMKENVKILWNRSESVPMGAPLTTPKSKMSGYTSHPISSRRSRQAKARASKLRKMYGLDRVSVIVSTLWIINSNTFACFFKISCKMNCHSWKSKQK